MIERLQGLAIDPGTRSLGWAVVGLDPLQGTACQLLSAGYFEASKESGLHSVVHEFENWITSPFMPPSVRLIQTAIIERPEPYTSEHQKGGQAGQLDLHDLSMVVGALGYMLQRNHGVDVRYVFPKDWKGQIPKNVSKTRVEEALSEEEMSRVMWPIKSKRHNVIDAIHLGLRTFTTRRV